MHLHHPTTVLWSVLAALAVTHCATRPVSAQAPPNDECEGAILISGPLPATVSGSTTSANISLEPPAIDFCGTVSHNSVDVWYTVMGTGNTMIATTCNDVTNYDTKLHVYCGGCDGTICVTGNDDGTVGTGCDLPNGSSFESRVSWCSTAGTEYLILVHGFDGAMGTFQLTVDVNAGFCTGASSCVPPPPNDECDGAILLTLPADVTGSTAQATISPEPPAIDACGTTHESRDVWYRLVGTGNTLTASTCNDGTNYDTKLHIYCGGCPQPICVAGNDDQFGAFDPACEISGTQGINRRSTVAWCSTAGTEYFILVHGFGSVTGTFQLTVDADTVTCTGASSCVLAPNDECEGAVPLTLPADVTGSTADATQTPEPPVLDLCGSEPIGHNARDVWYSVVGTGNTITASTCNAGTEYDTQLDVYCGACDSTVCVTGNDDVPGGCTSAHPEASTVVWCSSAGTEYFILVSGLGSTAFGSFRLTATDDGAACTGAVGCPPANDECAGAEAIAGPFPASATGSTTSATPSPTPPVITDCGTTHDGSKDLWYAVTGTGNRMSATTCSNSTDFDTKLHVYCGTCDETFCVTGNDSSDISGCPQRGNFSRLSYVDWCSRAGATYYILVFGANGESGPFELIVDDDGTVCTGAVPCSDDGACCNMGTCSVVSPGQCAQNGGDYQGDGTSCSSAPRRIGGLFINSSIPDNDPTGRTFTFNVPDSFTVADLNVELIVGGRQGDLFITLEHGAVSSDLVLSAGSSTQNACVGGVPDGYTAMVFGMTNDPLIIDDEGSVGLACYDGGGTGQPGYSGPAIPTEPLSAFDGMDAQGDWLLHISDRVAGPAASGPAALVFGVLDFANAPVYCPPPMGACCLECGCMVLPEADCAAAGGVFLGVGISCNAPLTDSATMIVQNGDIPDNDPAGFSSTIGIPPSMVTIGLLGVRMNITHPFQGDLRVELSHDGTTIVLMSRPGRNATQPDGHCPGGPLLGYDNNDFNVGLFDITDGPHIDCYNGSGGGIDGYTGPAKPSQPLSAFSGATLGGDWTLKVIDANAGNVGTLNQWILYFITDPICPLETTPPTLMGCPDPGPTTFECPATLPPAPTVTATDNCDPDVDVMPDEFSEGDSCLRTTHRSWRASDLRGNESTCEQTLVVQDTTGPVLTCQPEPIVFTCTGPEGFASEEADIPFPTAVDACNGVSSIGTTFPVVFEPTCGGPPHVVTFTATDTCGNTSNCQVFVVVKGERCCPALSDSELTLMIPNLDFTAQVGHDGGPVTTKAKFDIWNQNEIRFSGLSKCITCWDSTLLSLYPMPNLFLASNIQTEMGRARIDGVAEPQCVGAVATPLLGVITREITFAGCPQPSLRSSRPLTARGTQDARILYSPIDLRSAEDAPLRVGLPENVAGTGRQGALLVWAKVEVKWNFAGEIIRDTFIELTNDGDSEVGFQLYLVNGEGPLDEVRLFGVLLERAHQGWNNTDEQIRLTPNEPTYWSAHTGAPKGITPFSNLDGGPPLGRPDPDPRNPGGRMVRGFVVGWAVNADGVEIKYNRLGGRATVVDYNEASAHEYEAWVFRCVAPVADLAAPDGTPGRLLLDGMEYDAAPEKLLTQFFVPWSPAFTNRGALENFGPGMDEDLP